MQAIKCTLKEILSQTAIVTQDCARHILSDLYNALNSELNEKENAETPLQMKTPLLSGSKRASPL